MHGFKKMYNFTLFIYFSQDFDLKILFLHGKIISHFTFLAFIKIFFRLMSASASDRLMFLS